MLNKTKEVERNNPFRNGKMTVKQLQEHLAETYDENTLILEKIKLMRFAGTVILFINVILSMKPKVDSINGLMIGAMRINSITSQADTIEKMKAAEKVIAETYREIVAENLEHMELISISSVLGEVCNRLGFKNPSELQLPQNIQKSNDMFLQVQNEAEELIREEMKKNGYDFEEVKNDPDFQQFAKEVLEESKKMGVAPEPQKQVIVEEVNNNTEEDWRNIL